MISFHLLMINSILCSMNINISSLASIKSCSKQVQQQMLKYYDPYNEDGAIFDNNALDSSRVHWFESGIMWTVIADYIMYTQYLIANH